MAELIKPCPFCGSEAELIVFNYEYGTVTVGCSNEDCDITMGKGFFSDEEAIEAWNNRATEAEIRAKTIDEALKALSIFNDREHGNKHFFYGIETAKEILEQLKEE